MDEDRAPIAKGSKRAITAVLALALAAIASWVTGAAFAQRAEVTEITVFAAASLKNALDAAAADYQKATGAKVAISYAASSALAKQIEQAAPADLFISADLDWMEYLNKKGLIKDGTKISLLGNSLVLIAPAASKLELNIAPGFPLAAALGEGKLATGDVKSVPVGKYAKVALERLGVWTAVEGKIAQTENVRAALALVAREEAALGIVYRTDAHAEPRVKVLGTFPEDTHPPIVYPFAITAGASNPEGASAFLKFLASDAVKGRFESEGFTVLKH